MLSTATQYMVNPSILMPPPQTTTMPFPRKREQTSSPEDSEEEEEYQPGPSTSKRARKAPASVGNGGSGKGTKMSREALRKANHSLIERRRREKINFALGELRGMVPGLGEEKGGKAGEFKLEVSYCVPSCRRRLMVGPGTDCRTHERPQGGDHRTRSESSCSWRYQEVLWHQEIKSRTNSR